MCDICIKLSKATSNIEYQACVEINFVFLNAQKVGEDHVTGFRSLVSNNPFGSLTPSI